MPFYKAISTEKYNILDNIYLPIVTLQFKRFVTICARDVNFSTPVIVIYSRCHPNNSAYLNLLKKVKK